jgi:K+-transporting ATPase c subunit
MRDPVTTTVSGVDCAAAGESAAVKVAVIAAPRKSEERRLNVIVVKGTPILRFLAMAGRHKAFRAFGCFGHPHAVGG